MKMMGEDEMVPGLGAAVEGRPMELLASLRHFVMLDSSLGGVPVGDPRMSEVRCSKVESSFSS